MALPKKLKQMNVFVDGTSWLGVAESFTPASLARQTESYRGGGMPGGVKADMGFEDDALDTQAVFGGFVEDMIRHQAKETVDGLMVRFMGSYQRDDTGETTAVEIVQRGRIINDDQGEQKGGESNQMTTSFANAYYKLTVNGEVLREVDLVAGIDIVDGEDRMEKHRQNIGV
ncbi:phage major tail tube protein [Idiomarina abyssalis]|uniref:phage major tail tube protein n=1 Tax=Idiomarina abyssalis TaxID=86102 RepID=UPI001CD76F46|nr:phage major tail tube protein [Idiomarina abyssalis]